MKQAPLVRAGLVTVRASKTVPTEDGRGWVSRPNGWKSATVQISIDVEGLLNDLGERALFSKGKRARAQGGLIEVKVVSDITHTGKVYP